MSTTTGSNPITMNDVKNCLRCCADAFAQLAALLLTIKEKAPEHSDAGKLAALGWSVAYGMENFAGTSVEQMQERRMTI